MRITAIGSILPMMELIEFELALTRVTVTTISVGVTAEKGALHQRSKVLGILLYHVNEHYC